MVFVEQIGRLRWYGDEQFIIIIIIILLSIYLFLVKILYNKNSYQ